MGLLPSNTSLPCSSLRLPDLPRLGLCGSPLPLAWALTPLFKLFKVSGKGHSGASGVGPGASLCCSVAGVYSPSAPAGLGLVPPSSTVHLFFIINVLKALFYVLLGLGHEGIHEPREGLGGPECCWSHRRARPPPEAVTGVCLALPPWPPTQHHEAERLYLALFSKMLK